MTKTVEDEGMEWSTFGEREEYFLRLGNVLVMCFGMD